MAALVGQDDSIAIRDFRLDLRSCHAYTKLECLNVLSLALTLGLTMLTVLVENSKRDGRRVLELDITGLFGRLTPSAVLEVFGCLKSRQIDARIRVTSCTLPIALSNKK